MAEPGVLAGAIEQFQAHRQECFRCGNWMVVRGQPGRLCERGQHLWRAVEAAQPLLASSPPAEPE